MEMFLRKPEYFLTVAREGSIVKAAKALYVSEPYLSQYITKLERENNTIFLYRQPLCADRGRRCAVPIY